MGKTFNLPDGSQITWIDRETLEYSETGRSTLVWVDYGPGLFSKKRVLRTSSILEWNPATRAGSVAMEITPADRARIIRAVSDYYEAEGVNLIVEES
jgi:hypothetical protein